MNHVRGGEWTSPDLESALNEVKKQGIQNLVYYPFGFLADNAETQLEGQLELQKFPRLNILHLPCFNTWPPFLHYLADRILLK